MNGLFLRPLSNATRSHEGLSRARVQRRRRDDRLAHPGPPKPRAPKLRRSCAAWDGSAVFAFWGGAVEPSELKRATAERWVKVKGNKSPGQGRHRRMNSIRKVHHRSSPTRRVILRTRRYHSPSGAKPPPAMNLNSILAGPKDLLRCRLA